METSFKACETFQTNRRENQKAKRYRREARLGLIYERVPTIQCPRYQRKFHSHLGLHSHLRVHDRRVTFEKQSTHPRFRGDRRREDSATTSRRGALDSYRAWTDAFAWLANWKRAICYHPHSPEGGGSMYIGDTLTKPFIKTPVQVYSQCAHNHRHLERCASLRPCIIAIVNKWKKRRMVLHSVKRNESADVKL